MGKLNFDHLILGGSIVTLGLRRHLSKFHLSSSKLLRLGEARSSPLLALAAQTGQICATRAPSFRREEGKCKRGGERLHPPHSVNLKSVKLSIGESYGLHLS